MNACVGWETPEPCPIHGQFHGCSIPTDAHLGKHHRCSCGALGRATTPRKRGPRRDMALGCGTNAGYRRHGLDGTPPCDDCKRAHARYQAERKARKIA